MATERRRSRPVSGIYNVFIETNILLEGWMMKSPPEHKLKTKSDWLKRYFMILDLQNEESYFAIQQVSKKRCKDWEKKSYKFCLVYWKNENHTVAKPIRVIPLRDCSINTFNDAQWNDSFPYMLQLHSNDRKYLFCAENETKREIWINALNDAIEKSATETPVYQTLDDIRRQLPNSARCSLLCDENVKHRRDSGYSETSITSVCSSNPIYDNIKEIDIKNFDNSDNSDNSSIYNLNMSFEKSENAFANSESFDGCESYNSKSSVMFSIIPDSVFNDTEIEGVYVDMSRNATEKELYASIPAFPTCDSNEEENPYDLINDANEQRRHTHDSSVYFDQTNGGHGKCLNVITFGNNRDSLTPSPIMSTNNLNPALPPPLLPRRPCSPLFSDNNVNTLPDNTEEESDSEDDYATIGLVDIQLRLSNPEINYLPQDNDTSPYATILKAKRNNISSNEDATVEDHYATVSELTVSSIRDLCSETSDAPTIDRADSLDKYSGLSLAAGGTTQVLTVAKRRFKGPMRRSISNPETATKTLEIPTILLETECGESKTLFRTLDSKSTSVKKKRNSLALLKNIASFSWDV